MSSKVADLSARRSPASNAESEKHLDPGFRSLQMFSSPGVAGQTGGTQLTNAGHAAAEVR
jgi:hypothetical protein